ncbi:MAG: Hpt domain-containing protein [Planctomycetes bacterium]|nr:Hpt domain-containing protein [Planctomycetota bacterium]
MPSANGVAKYYIMNQHPAFDHQRINSLTELFGDQECVRDLYIEFLDSCPDRLAVIKQGLSERRADLIEFAAHAIHGTSSNIGVLNIEQTSAAIESIAHQGQFDLVGAYINELEEQIAGLREHVDLRTAI